MRDGCHGVRRRALCAAGFAGLSAPAAARPLAIEVLTADWRPFAIARGPEPGVALSLVAELYRLLGVAVVFTFLPPAEARARAMARPGAAIAPAIRGFPGDSALDWAVPLFEAPDVLAAVGRAPPDTLEAALTAGVVAVTADSPWLATLRDRGFHQLLAVPDGREAVLALYEGGAQAWLTPAAEAAWRLGRAARLSPRIGGTVRWLAQNPAGAEVPPEELRDAYAALEADGSVEVMLRHVVRDVP